MPAGTWERAIGNVIEGRYRLRTVTYSGRRQAEFLADPISPEARREPITVTLIDPLPDEVEGLRSQMALASRLHHPNLLRIADAGQCRLGGQNLLYLASETPDGTLADALASGPLQTDAAEALLSDVVGALSFVHSQGLVYRSLEPQTTVQAGGRWKLADFGQLCAPAPDTGSYSGVSDSPYIPPEARYGVVHPAWDVWALGALVREVLTGSAADAAEALPPRFAQVVEACMQDDPEARPSIEQIRAMLKPEPELPVQTSTEQPLPAVAEHSLRAAPPPEPPGPVAVSNALGEAERETRPVQQSGKASAAPQPYRQPFPAEHRPGMRKPNHAGDRRRSSEATSRSSSHSNSPRNVWYSLRGLALISIACLACFLIFSWMKSAPNRSTPPAPPEEKAVVATPARKSPSAARNAQRPSPMTRRAVERAGSGSSPIQTQPVLGSRPETKSEPEAASPPGAAKTQPANGAEVGRADYSSSDMDGRRTASGERFSSNALTAAHPTYPLGTRLRVTNLANDKSVVVRVNDRGSFTRGRVVRLTKRAAQDLGMTQAGSGRVRVEVVE